MLNLRCVYIYICDSGGAWNGACMKVETGIIVPKLMAKYEVKWKHYRCYMVPQDLRGGKPPLISHILAHDSLSEQERGKKGKQEMQFVDDKKELRMKNRESIP